MNLHTDIPTRAQIGRLLTARTPSSVSVYLPTDPASPGNKERIALKNLTTEALRQLELAQAPRVHVEAIDTALSELGEDEEFWRYQARSLALFVTPTTLITFRLPNQLVALVEVSDRFHLKPLLRSVTFPQVAFVLALAQGSVRVLEVVANLEPSTVDVEDLPSNIADAVGKASVTDRSPSRRIQGTEGRKVRMRQYARQINDSLRPLLNGLEVPLILAATKPLESIFRSVNTYPYLASEGITGNPEAVLDAELISRARSVLDRLQAKELRALQELYERRSSEGRATEDIAEVARAATFGAVDTLLVDFDEVVSGYIVEETGEVKLDASDDALNYGVIDEIARRVWLSGGRVLAVRRDDIPGGASLAAILRFRFQAT